MKVYWQRFLAALTPGVRGLLGLLAVVYLTAVIGALLHAFNLYGWLALSGTQFWSGQVWRLVSFVLLPIGLPDFAMNGIALVMLGRLLERHWSLGEFWVCCAVAAMGAGIAKVLLQISSPMPLTGAAPMVFGLLFAWGFLCGREVIYLPVFGETTVWKLVLAAAAISVVMMFLTAGTVAALILAAGGFTSWLFLWLKHKWLMSRAGRVAESGRINRLEL